MSDYRPCGPETFCPTLAKRIRWSGKSGIVGSPIVNFNTGEEVGSLVWYAGGAKDKGLVLNFCPWCGQPLNVKVKAENVGPWPRVWANVAQVAAEHIDAAERSQQAALQRVIDLEAEVARLKTAIAQLEPRAAFGDQCYQDQCENAYVEQSVAKRLREELMALQSAVSPSRVGMVPNDYFIAVVNRMRCRENAVYVAEAKACTREAGHGGPCNGLPCAARKPEGGK